MKLTFMMIKRNEISDICHIFNVLCDFVYGFHKSVSQSNKWCAARKDATKIVLTSQNRNTTGAFLIIIIP